MKTLSTLLLTVLVVCVWAQKLTLVPGFTVCSIEIDGNGKNCVKYRESGEAKWLKAPELVDVEKKDVLRGSLLGLKENTDYELSVTANGKTHLRQFKTRCFDVPVAETIYLDKRNCGRTFKPKSGTAKGYIRYTAKPGFVFNSGKKAGIGILIQNAQYIILDGLTINGGKFNAVRIRNSKHIRVLNCDISGFGQGGVFRPDLDGKYYNAKNNPIWHDAGISVRGCDDIIIERNYIHDPKTPGNSWFYSHPAGSDGIFIGDTRRAVIRYNDIVGSDKFRWNDAIASDCNNFSAIGGPSEDAEIYGNYFAFGNDDSVELDGGQKNCRFFFNRIEGFFCGVSIAAVIRGPSYVFCNEIIRPGDEFGLRGVALKALCGRKHFWGRAFFYRNKAEGNPMGYPRMKGTYSTPRFICRENVYINSPENGMYETFKENNYTVDINDKLKAPDGVPDYPEALPVRNGLLSQDKTFVMFCQPGKMAPQQVTIRYNGSKSSGYRVRICDATQHFSVTPRAGTVEPGQSISFTVAPKQCSSARMHSGAFIFRLEDGWSLPVSVYLDNTRDKKLLRKVRESIVIGSIEKKADVHKMTFDIPADGKYTLFVNKNKKCANRVELLHPDGKSELRRMRLRDNRYSWDTPEHPVIDKKYPAFELTRGKHVIILRQSSKSSMIPDISGAFLCNDPHLVLPLLPQINEVIAK